VELGIREYRKYRIKMIVQQRQEIRKGNKDQREHEYQDKHSRSRRSHKYWHIQKTWWTKQHPPSSTN